jgi:hypothetical protein
MILHCARAKDLNPMKTKRNKELTDKIRNADIKKLKKSEIIEILQKYNIKIIGDKDHISTTKNICALNKTCERVNDLMMSKTHAFSKFYLNQQLICKRSFKQKSKQVGYVNFTYTIVNIEDNKYTLSDDENDDIIVSIEQLESYFKLPYARTCHSQQGLSIDEKITIFDLNHFMVNTKWIYTAITRTTDLKNIQFYMGSKYSLNSNGFEAVNYKQKTDIENHKITDSNAKRDMSDYVDVNWAFMNDSESDSPED